MNVIPVGEAISRVVNGQIFNKSLSTNTTDGWGIGDATFTRSGNQYIEDHEGIYRKLDANEMGFTEARVVTNIITDTNDMTTGNWSLGGTATAPSANTVNFPATGDTISQKKAGVTGSTGQTFIQSVVLSGTGTLSLVILNDDGSAYLRTQVTLSSTPQRFTHSYTVNSGDTQGLDMWFRLFRDSTDTATSVTVSNCMLEESTGRSDTTTPSEFVDGTKWFDKTNGNSVTSNIVTESTGTSLLSEPYSTITCIGDSFGNDTYEYVSKVDLITSLLTVTNKCTPGDKLSNMDTRFSADVTGGDLVSIQGGVNDIIADRTLAQMQSSVTSMLAKAQALGIKVILVNVGPWKSNASWTTARQTVTDDYNAWLASYASTNNLSHVDIYTLLEGTADTLSASYDVGDGLHPNEAGSIVIGDALAATFNDNRHIQGFLSEVYAVNRVLYCRDFTNAAWVKTNITAALDATGIDGMPSSASTLTATAGNGTCFQTVTLASSGRSTSFFVRRKTGSGTIEITDNGGTNYTDITSQISTAWTKVHYITRTQANPVIGFRIVTSGDEIEVDFAALEDSTLTTSPILTTSTSASRTATKLTYPTTDNISDTEGTLYIEITPHFSTADSPPLMYIAATSSTGRYLYIHTGTYRIASYDGTNVRTTSVNLTKDVKSKVAIRWSATTGKQRIYIDGTGNTEGNFDGSWSDSGTFGIGSREDGSQSFVGEIENVKIYNKALSDTELQRMTT